jgi:pyruvate formate-lyase activating enzyme-like uncharacterized protein
MQLDLATMIAHNRAELGEYADRLRWLRVADAPAFEERRRAVLARLAPDTAWAFSGTKADGRDLSPGCVTCGEGSWACLFVNGVCNARCFFCPAPQLTRDPPETSGLPFPDVTDFLDYVERFGFRGVSLSGGEPLLTEERTLEFLTALRERFGRGLYLWLYSNGLLATPERLARLAAAGLDEIRFNALASEYDLAAIRAAVGLFPRVTVEIPAPPGEAPRLVRLAEELAQIGVRHLNLHQLRATPHNARHLIERADVTLLHGHRVVVIESELAALEVLAEVQARGLPLAVNCCLSAFRARHQEAAGRHRAARDAARPHEAVTPNGYLRGLAVRGSPAALAALVPRLRERWPAPGTWRLDDGGARLVFAAPLWEDVVRPGLALEVDYGEAFVVPAVTYRHAFVKVPLNERRDVFVERRVAAARRVVPPDAWDRLRALLDPATPTPTEGEWSGWLAFERLRPGLQPYAESAAP